MSSVAYPAGPRLPMAAQTVWWGLRPASFLAWCKSRYGPTFRIRLIQAQPTIVVSEPEDLRAVFALSGDQFIAGETAAILLEPFLGPTSLLVLDGSAHRDERKRMQQVLRGAGLDAYADLIRGAAEREIRHWPSDRSFPVHAAAKAITLDAILAAVFGTDVHEELARLRLVLSLLLEGSSGSLLILIPQLRANLGPRSPWGHFIRQRDALHRAVLDLIAQARRRTDCATRSDILSSLITADPTVDDQQLLDEVMTLVLAGHDTTATGLAWTIDLLLHDPVALARLRRELAAGDEAYLDAVVHEALRLRPVVGEVSRTIREPFPITWGELPPMTTVVASIWLCHMDAGRYDDPRAFRPERFLGAAPDLTTWLPFGGGVRRCLGAGFALMQMREVLRAIVSGADVRPTRSRLDRPKRRAVTAIPRHGCPVRASKTTGP